MIGTRALTRSRTLACVVAIMMSATSCQGTSPVAPTDKVEGGLPGEAGNAHGKSLQGTTIEVIQGKIEHYLPNGDALVRLPDGTLEILEVSGGRRGAEPIYYGSCPPILWVPGDCAEGGGNSGLKSPSPLVNPVHTPAPTPTPRPASVLGTTPPLKTQGQGVLWLNTSSKYLSPGIEGLGQTLSIDVVATPDFGEWVLSVDGYGNTGIQGTGATLGRSWPGTVSGQVRPLPDGKYTLRLTSKGTSRTREVVIDTQPPVFANIALTPTTFEPLTNAYEAKGTTDVYDFGLSGIKKTSVSASISGLGTSSSKFSFNAGTNTLSYSSNITQAGSFAYHVLDHENDLSDAQTSVTLKLDAKDLAGNTTTIVTNHYLPLPSAQFSAYAKEGGQYVIYQTIALRLLQISINAYNACVILAQRATTYLQSLISRGASPDKVATAQKQVQTANSNLNEARNVVYHELYKVELRIAMEKPVVRDPGLVKIVDSLYRAGATLGSGSTAAAIRYELQTGQPVGNKFHLQKGHESITRLTEWLAKNPTARPSDRAAAENLLRDIKQAIGI